MGLRRQEREANDQRDEQCQGWIQPTARTLAEESARHAFQGARS
jgi:hypothetical protein